MDGDAGDLGKALFDEIFECGENVVDAGDGVIALHDAVAGDQNVVIHLANPDVVAVDEFIVIARHVIEEGFDGEFKLAHFANTDFWCSDVTPEWLDVDVDIELMGAFSQGDDGVLQFRGPAMSFAKR